MSDAEWEKWKAYEISTTMLDDANFFDGEDSGWSNHPVQNGVLDDAR